MHVASYSHSVGPRLDTALVFLYLGDRVKWRRCYIQGWRRTGKFTWEGKAKHPIIRELKSGWGFYRLRWWMGINPRRIDGKWRKIKTWEGGANPGEAGSDR